MSEQMIRIIEAVKEAIELKKSTLGFSATLNVKDVEALVDEIERLKQGYCPIKEKCNKGECDCTNEEYNQMCEENIKLDLEIERLNNIINRTLLVLEHIEDDRVGYEVCIDILKGSDKE